MSEFPNNLQDVLDRAIKLCEDQMKNPDIYNDDTLGALQQISAVAGYLKIKSAEYVMRGEKAKGAFIKANSDSLQTIIDALKYKINANQRSGFKSSA